MSDLDMAKSREKYNNNIGKINMGFCLKVVFCQAPAQLQMFIHVDFRHHELLLDSV
jgi:hypothetical protein